MTSMIRAPLAAVLLFAAAASCGREEDPEPPPPAEGPVEEAVEAEIPQERTTFRGEVYQTGSAVGTLTMLSLEDLEAALRLTGELEEELRRLSGAIVEVEGERVQAYPEEGLDVRRYEILRVDGARPHVGVLEETDETGLRLRDAGEALLLEGAPEGLREHVGARIWVVGDRRAGVLRLSSYGIIRPR